jgi:hypothetical protein
VKGLSYIQKQSDEQMMREYLTKAGGDPQGAWNEWIKFHLMKGIPLPHHLNLKDFVQYVIKMK